MDATREPGGESDPRRVEPLEVSALEVWHCGRRMLVTSSPLVGPARVRYWRCPACGRTYKTSDSVAGSVGRAAIRARGARRR